MVPLYAARIGNPELGDFVKVDRGACSRTALLTTAFLSGLGLKTRVRCRGGSAREDTRSCRSNGQSQSPETLSIAEPKKFVRSNSGRCPPCPANLIRYTQLPWRNLASLPGHSDMCCDGIEIGLVQAKERGRDEELFVRIVLLRRFAKISVLARTRSLASLGAALRRSA
jgi:hypothetical protein